MVEKLRCKQPSVLKKYLLWFERATDRRVYTLDSLRLDQLCKKAEAVSGKSNGIPIKR